MGRVQQASIQGPLKWPRCAMGDQPRRNMAKILRLALVGLVVGLALGLLIGWRLWPVSYSNTTPPQLRQDYKNDYILMVASEYQVEGDAEQALARLSLLDQESPTQALLVLAEQLIISEGREEDILILTRLADALQVATPAMAPYLEEPQ